jgi:hypothetical protein
MTQIVGTLCATPFSPEACRSEPGDLAEPTERDYQSSQARISRPSTSTAPRSRALKATHSVDRRKMAAKCGSGQELVSRAPRSADGRELTH